MTDLIDEVANRVAAEISWQLDPPRIIVGVSNRHVHLDRADLQTLFGEDEFTLYKKVRQPGQFAAVEKVDITGPRSGFKHVRCMGPCRKASQVELSLTDARALGLKAPVTQSGHLENAAEIEIASPRATIVRPAAIAAARHIHMGEGQAKQLGLHDQDIVSVAFGGPRGGVMDEVIIRTAPEWLCEFHVDTDEANAFGLRTGDFVTLLRK
jgi:putative phosphotransacetylase